MKTVTKQEIIQNVSERAAFQLSKSAEITKVLIEIIKRTLEAGEDILVSGFGKFQVKGKDKRRGRNPATGEDMILEERQVVTFKCSGQLKKKLNPPEQKPSSKQKN